MFYTLSAAQYPHCLCFQEERFGGVRFPETVALKRYGGGEHLV